MGSGSGAATGTKPQDVNIPGPNGEPGHFEVEEYSDSDANYSRQIWVPDPVTDPSPAPAPGPDPNPEPGPDPLPNPDPNEDPDYWVKRKSILGMASLIG